VLREAPLLFTIVPLLALAAPAARTRWATSRSTTPVVRSSVVDARASTS
jgi:hypothetical protein